MDRDLPLTNNQYFDKYNSLNDFVKINNNKLAFIYTTYYYTRENEWNKIKQGSSSREVCILIIHIYEKANFIFLNDYYINFETFVPSMQISAFSYNDYLLFSTTVMPQSGSLLGEDYPEYISIFMIFGYANGTDSIIDISEYFYDEGSKFQFF